MKKFNSFALAAALLFGCAFLAPLAAAQAGPPVMVKQITPKPVWLKAEVVHFDRNTMTVRVAGDTMRILTFTYADSAQAQVQKALDKGGYQYGDTIKIRYVPQTSVALAVRGKLSKGSAPKTRKPTAPLRTRAAGPAQ